MKHIVLFDELNEYDIKPEGLMREYVDLTEKDIKSFFLADNTVRDCPCPACGGETGVHAFMKFGMSYLECANCRSLYVTPRPDDAKIMDYYKNSSARKFWKDKLSKSTCKKRAEKIIKPRVQWIRESREELLPEAEIVADINTSQYGYLQELAKSGSFKKEILVNPFFNGDGLGDHPDTCVYDNFEIDDKVDIITLFEVIDHSSDINNLFDNIKKILREGGLCFVTTILITGFDLQLLWDKSGALFPPDRLNVLSVEGLKILFENHGFECLELSTPGVLDTETVVKYLALKKDDMTGPEKFISYMLNERGEAAVRDFQKFLQKNLLSSYCRAVFKKK